MSQTHRLPAGGRIDRDIELTFSVDGVDYTGHPGDTVASALLANGQIRVGDSISRHRPRGIMTASAEEPNALLRIDDGGSARTVCATVQEIAEGLQATTTCGVPAPGDDDGTLDESVASADVLVIGAGPAGLAAALSAARSHARVVLVDAQSELGGSLLSGRTERVDGLAALDWVDKAKETLAAAPGVTVLTRTAVSAQHLRARQVVLATGAHERPLVFAGNDRPGVMLAAGVRSYLNRYAVRPGEKAVVATTNDSAYDTVEDLLAAGVDVVAVLDARDTLSARAAVVEAHGVRVCATSAPLATEADPDTGRVTAVQVGVLDDDNQASVCWETIRCDVLAVSGGWSPALSLHRECQGETRWDAGLMAFVPDGTVRDQQVVGSAAGALTLQDCLSQGAAAGAQAASAAGFPVEPLEFSGTGPASNGRQARDVWLVPSPEGSPHGWDEHFVDLMGDQTVADVWGSTPAGLRSVEQVVAWLRDATLKDA